MRYQPKGHAPKTKTQLQGYDTTVMFGIVEDVQDPEQLNRVRIRLPHHGSKTDTPTNALPWSKILSPGMGVGPQQGATAGQAGLSVVNNAVVMALVNHDNHEDMTIIGTLPTNSTTKNILGASAAGQSSMALGGLKGGSTGGKFEPATDASKEILNPAPPAFPQTKGKYPDTHVNVSKAGMRTILHDVAGEIYQATVHPTGTFTEMQSDGNYVTYTTKDRKEAVDGEYTVGSQKNMAITTFKDLQIRVKETFKIYAKNFEIIIDENMDTQVKGDQKNRVSKTQTNEVKGNITTTSDAVHKIVGKSKVDINP